MNAEQEPIARPHGSRSPLLDAGGIAANLSRLDGWHIEDIYLVKSYHFETAADAGEFVHSVGDAAEVSNHHPHVHWWKRDVRIELYTHKSNGLTIRDFEFAARCDTLNAMEPA